MNTLSRYVRPDLSEARLARQLDNISGRLSSRGHGKLAMALAAALMLAVVVVALAWPRGTGEPVALIESVAAGQTLTLPEGSRVVLDANSRLRLSDTRPNSVRLELERGGVEVEATHRDERRFVLVAAGREVRVIGTHFFVRFLGDARHPELSVSVERGVVEVKEPKGEIHRVAAGETWESELEEAHASSAPLASEAPALPEPSAEAAVAPSASAAAVPRPAESAKQLFARAQRARAAGRTAEARAAFAELRRRYPDDPRAPLAAFELGRMQIDADEDPGKAAELFDEALKHSPEGSTQREDAEARRVEALARAGDRAACAAARDAYLKRYPKGVHRARVAQACR